MIIKRPSLLQQLTMPELLRWTQHTTDNIDRINQRPGKLVVIPSVVHNTLTMLPDPPGFTPTGFLALSALTAAGERLQLVGNPVLTPAGTSYGIKAQYAAPYGEISLARAANLAIPDTVYTATIWDTQVYMAGNLSHSLTTNPTRITCAVPGIVEVAAYAFYPPAAGYKEQVIDLNGDANAYGYTIGASDIATYFSHSSVDCMNVTVAGDYFTFLLQSVGAATTMTGRITARYVSPPLTQSATVTGILWG